MDLAFSADEQMFRDEARQFLRDNFPIETQRKLAQGQALSRGESAEGARILNRKGVPSWPKEFGGAGWTPMQQYIFAEEVRKFPARTLFGYGVTLVGPVIYTFGNQAQKQYYLPRIANAEDWWCQGFSEPGSGSDLASLKTQAVRDGDCYVVNGQKLWTSWAHLADWMFCLVRTNPNVKKQQGISFLLINMKTPGITVRPLQLIDGTYEVSEVFFDNVRVPIENLVGEENKGWDYAKFLLSNERFSDAGVGVTTDRIQRVKSLAAQSYVAGERLIDQRAFGEKLAGVEVQLKAFEITQLRVVCSALSLQKGEQNPASSILKLKGSELEQASAELLMDAVGPYGLAFFSEEDRARGDEPQVGPDGAARVAPTYFNSRAASIYSGSSEIQKNIIAKAILGL
ncbi:alkylation response protein AidB-like acyl-CoA dehydrogenase [Bradyrhizobium sp. GM0.4]